MSFDPLVTNPGRLSILTALAVEESQEFVQLREATRLTDGNLASHARRLQTAGMIAVDKHFREGKPVTSFTLTTDGRKALEAHTRRLIAAISHRRLAVVSGQGEVAAMQPKPRVVKVAKVTEPVVVGQQQDDDWVD
ncbi:MAG TPA: transcriptional regulator [Tepidisphaeraceae bacterium]|nr:transcriptional regulator [Tepidisphaeraceae bacterium]